MFKLIKELFALLTPGQRKRFYVLQVLVVVMAFSEIIGVASIAPFMALVGDMSILERDSIITSLYLQSGFSTPHDFIFWLGVAVLITLTISAFISMFTTWRLSMFANKVGTEIADRLFTHYLRQGWLFHSSCSSAQLTKKIANESTRVTGLVIQPLMLMNARIALVSFLSIAIFIYNPLIAISALSVFLVAYIFLYKLVRLRLQKNGKTISNVFAERYQLMNEGFGGIKDVLLLGRSAYFENRFINTGERLAYSQGANSALAQVPRYFMELVAFGLMIALVLYLIKTHQGKLGLILPVLSVYALAGMKLLPALQQIYHSSAQIKGNISAFQSIKQDLQDSQTSSKHFDEESSNVAYFKVQNNIKLENITFKYPGKTEPALKDFNMTVFANSVVGIVGPSGSGKSTAIDVLLGLIKPQQGQLLIDNQPVDSANRRAWQNTIGFVPQSIFLSEGTIAENVAFGIPKNKINKEQVKKALQLAHLEELVLGLPQDIDTKVGERGVQISGGQRQRIGIARALYHEADVLVFDEATSSLDGITEKMIMEAIHDFSGQKTIIMIAHRLKTVQKCDTIFMIEQGRVVDQGTYKGLLKSNQQFKKMVEHA